MGEKGEEISSSWDQASRDFLGLTAQHPTPFQEEGIPSCLPFLGSEQERPGLFPAKLQGTGPSHPQGSHATQATRRVE